MNRFGYQKQKIQTPKFLLSVCTFLLIFFLFVQGISSFSNSTRKRQKESLENALMRGITYCYTMEGSYPESLDYLKAHYGLTYNEDLFFVDYRVTGTNILPDVTIIERKAKQ